MTKKILITGSRDADLEMLRRLDDTLWNLIGRDIHIIVGDADGVDYHTMIFCDEHDIPYECHGAYGKMRHKAWNGFNIAHQASYLERDQIMVSLLDPERDECYAFWNGKHLKSGTIATARYATRRGVKVSWLWKTPNSL